MKKSYKQKKMLPLLLFFLISTPAFFAGCNDSDSSSGSKTDDQTTAKAKYVFLFIGDGMAEVQVNAAEVYKASVEAQADPNYINSPRTLEMSKLPATGYATTYDAGSFITDSASAGTALACGHKTLNGVIGMDVTKTKTYKTIAEAAKEKGMKVGIVSSVSIDHATPASFYAQVDSREKYYEIGMQLAESNFDYFAGGGFRDNKYPGDKKNTPACVNAAIGKGYKYVNKRADFEALNNKSGKVIAVNSVLDSSRAMPYEIIRDKSAGNNDISLAEFTKKGIEILDNPEGFFMMVEGGKIDWACHANDAAAAIQDTLAFDSAVAEALAFYKKHPDETLIIVTGDHECGGMTIGFSGTGYFTYMERMKNQTMSYDKFDTLYANDLSTVNSLSELNEEIESSFGLDMDKNGDVAYQLNDYQQSLLEEAFDKKKNGQGSMSKDEFYLLYGGYNPLSVTLTHVLNQISGIAWTSYSHTGVPVPVFAKGVNETSFNGYYDNTDVCKKVASVMGLSLFK